MVPQATKDAKAKAGALISASKSAVVQASVDDSSQYEMSNFWQTLMLSESDSTIVVLNAMMEQVYYIN